jgi:drug/metabolite transporter (DMT)-like permease
LFSFRKGLWFALGAAFCFSLMSLCTKAAHLPAQEVILARSIMNLIASGWLLKRNKISPFGSQSNLLSLLGRGLAGYTALSAYFYSLKELPIGMASLVQYTSPIFSGVFAFFVIKELTSWRQWVCLIFGLLGIGFVSHVLPFGQIRHDIPAVYWLTCISSAVLSGLAYVFVRKLSIAKEHPEVILFYFPLISLPFSLGFTLFNWVTPNIWQWFLLFGVGVTSYLGQIFLTYSLQSEKTVTATNMLYFGALFATIWGLLFFAEKLTWEFLVGASLIIGCQLLLSKKDQKAVLD